MSHYPHVTAILRIMQDAYADVPRLTVGLPCMASAANILHS